MLPTPSKIVFRYLLSVLKICSARNVYYKFSVLTVNIGMQSKSYDYKCKVTLQSRYKVIILKRKLN